MFAYWKRYPVYIDGECGCMNIVERQAHGEGCFDPDVMIQMEDKSWKKAGNLFEGDKVYNPVLDVGVEITSIVAGPEVKPMIEVGFGDKTIVVTDTHPLMTADGLKQAKNLTMDDKLIDDRGKERKITILHTMATKKGQMVINLILDVPEGYDKDFHMINANGIVSGDWTLQEKLSSEE